MGPAQWVQNRCDHRYHAASLRIWPGILSARALGRCLAGGGAELTIDTFYFTYPPGDETGRVLPSYLDGPRELAALGYVAKPLLDRGGAGVRVVTPGFIVEVTPATPDLGPLGHQAFHPLPDVDGNCPVLGAGVVDGEPAGPGVRETPGPITDTSVRFLPHLVRDRPQILTAARLARRGRRLP